jgi:thiamine-phosphate pyrophosphorylase
MKSYLITDPTFYTNDNIIFRNKLNNVLSNHIIDMVCFRDKSSSNIEELAKSFIEISKKNNIKEIFINKDISLANSLKFDGVHLTSMQFDKINEAKKLGLKVIISCHSDIDIKKAIFFGVDYITYSPIFVTPNKGKPKGISVLKRKVKRYNIPIIALGGITSKKEIKKVLNTHCYGFASIRYFINL